MRMPSEAIGARASIRRKAIIAAAASTLASIVMGGTLILIEDLFRESREEFRFQAREGFTVVERGSTVRIERTTQEPLVLTMPAMKEVDVARKFRWGADIAVVWFFFFAGTSPLPASHSE